jgi:6-pyruvoyltetrahydropterin/6-carboxytetrahydropterin synthase
MHDSDQDDLQTEICREYEFDAAHRLDWHPGKCRNLHGHTYRLEVTTRGGVDDRGVVMDFSELDAIVRTRVLDDLDHCFLNDVLDNPTAERIGAWIWRRLAESELALSELRLWETRRSSVRITHADTRP